MPSRNPHAAGEKCGAKTRAGGKCRQPAMPNGRCRLHGGLTPTGNALPQTRHGRYAKNLPDRLAASYEEALQDRELLSARAGISLLDARIDDMLARSEHGESLELWTMLRNLREEFKEASASGDEQEMKLALGKMFRIIDRGWEDWQNWNSIERSLESRRRQSDSEIKRLEKMHQMMTAEQAALLVVAVQEIIFRHVPEDDRREKIANDIRKLMNRENS